MKILGQPLGERHAVNHAVVVAACEMTAERGPHRLCLVGIDVALGERVGDAVNHLGAFRAVESALLALLGCQEFVGCGDNAEVERENVVRVFQVEVNLTARVLLRALCNHDRFGARGREGP